MTRFPESVSVCTVDDELVLLDSRSGKYFGLNAVGRRVYELLAENNSRSQIVEALLAEFDVEEAVLSKDVSAFIADLSARGLVETDEA